MLLAETDPEVRDWYVERAGAWSRAQLEAAMASRLPELLPSPSLRAVPDSAYAARIEPYGSRTRLAPGEARDLFFRVANLGTKRRPRGLDHSPRSGSPQAS
jgi:hypothetical protein